MNCANNTRTQHSEFAVFYMLSSGYSNHLWNFSEMRKDNTFDNAEAAVTTSSIGLFDSSTIYSMRVNYGDTQATIAQVV